MDLERQFQKSRYLCRALRIQLASDLSLSERQIKIWFQNRRMKQKKEDKSKFNITTISPNLTPSTSSHSSSPVKTASPSNFVPQQDSYQISNYQLPPSYNSTHPLQYPTNLYGNYADQSHYHLLQKCVKSETLSTVLTNDNFGLLPAGWSHHTQNVGPNCANPSLLSL